MADPFTIALAVGSGLQALSSVWEGMENADAAERQAVREREAAAKRAARIREQGLYHLGQVKVGAAGSGLAQHSGSVQAVLADEARKIKRDEMEALFQGRMRASSLEEYAGQARTAGFIRGSSALLRGGSQYYGYSDLRRTG